MASTNSFRVYIKNLSEQIDEGHLRFVFAKYGDITKCVLATDKAGRRLDYGFVDFKTRSSSERAVEGTNGVMLDGRCVSVQPFINRKEREEEKPFNNLFVKNFAQDINSDQELADLFDKFGRITSAKVTKDEQGNSKGFGFVCFSEPDSARKAILELDGYELPQSGKVLYVGKHIKRSEKEGSQRLSHSMSEDFWTIYASNFKGAVLNELGLKILFADFGKITRVVFAKDSEGKPMGFGYISFAFPEHARMAVQKMNGFLLTKTNKKLVVTKYQKKVERDSFTNLYVKNILGVYDTVYSFAQCFEEYGTITSVRLEKDKFNKSKGFGFISFATPSEAMRAVNLLNGKRLPNGLNMYVGKALKKFERQEHLKTLFKENRKVSGLMGRPPGQRWPDRSRVPDSCSVCMCDVELSDCFLLKCKHMSCKPCITDYVTFNINSREVDSIACPHNGCQEEIIYNMVKLIVPEAIHEKYERFLLENALAKMDDVVFCPDPECQAPVILDNIFAPTYGKCERCDFIFCTNCEDKYHGTTACEDFGTQEQKKQILESYRTGSDQERATIEKRYGKKRLKKAIDEELCDTFIKKNYKPCPSCKVDIEKIDGCNKMICTNCKSKFCWQCLELLNALSNPYDHFNQTKCQLFFYED